MSSRAVCCPCSRRDAVALCAVAITVVLSLGSIVQAADGDVAPTKAPAVSQQLAVAKRLPVADLMAEAQLVMRDLTERLLAQSRAQLKSGGDQDLFFSQIAQVLKEAVDFRRFALGVMGVYGSAKSLAALPPDERAQRTAQIDRFAELFIAGLVRNYGGIFITVLRLGDVEVETLAAKMVGADGKVMVEQSVSGVGNQPIRIYYLMQRRQASDRWELLNIAMDKLNLGKLFRSQFYALSAEHGDDLNQVIAHWSKLEVVQTGVAGGGRTAEPAERVKPPRGTGAKR